MSLQKDSDRPIVLLTGATGYVGARLLPLLEQQSIRLRCLSRDPDKLKSLMNADTEVVSGDVLDAASLQRALAGVHTAYYLVHLMSGSRDFEKEDRQAATNFVHAAREAGVSRIIYLGGLGDDSDPELSTHLRSRHEVGEILRESEVETIEFRASMVIGAGSLSYELMKSLTDRLPVMICPRWVSVRTQPIAVDDVLAYLLAARDLPQEGNRVFEVGGSDVVRYLDMIREYARQRGLHRWLISVPLLTPYLSGLWLALVTPQSYEVGRHLIEGLKNPTVVRDKTALKVFPILPIDSRKAIEKALAGEEDSRTTGTKS
ncbi:MAG: NAD(P)H-binding protein [Acidobacteriota bacterium]